MLKSANNNEVISLNNTIEQYTKGNIRFQLPEIILSDTEIIVSVEAGKTDSGTIILTNDKKSKMKGVVFSSNRHIEVKEKQFVGDEVVLHYTIDARNQEPTDVIEGEISIVSDCGERMIPVKATVVAASLQCDNLNIKNLFQFTDLAKEEPAKAVAMFKSERFEEVLLATEPWRYKEIYRSLMKGRSPSGALEEFLIAIHKKQPIQLFVSRLSFSYESINEPILDKIIITKDLWGYTEIKVTTDVNFIQLDHKLLWTDHFIGNQYSLQFQILPDKLREGKNYGCIYLETALQSFRIEVLCEQRKQLTQEQINANKVKNDTVALMKNYLNFRLQKIEFEDYISRSEEVIHSIESIQTVEWVHLFECHLSLIKGDRLKAKEILEEYDSRLAVLKMSNPAIYCAIYYLKALVYQEEVTIQEACQIIREMYESGQKEFIILWFLIYMDKRYIGNRKLLLEQLKEQYETGCHSPIMYFEAMSIYQAEPALLNEMSDFSAQTIHFGIRTGFLSEDVARQFAYLAGKERYYRILVFHVLEKIYAMYPQKDILAAICSTLIKGHQRAPKYFKWYKLGVESQLRVTELHEYFMYTIDEASTDPLPQPILLYFIYNSRLNDRKRAYLYARIVKGKAENSSIYRTYAKKIEQFASKQLLSKNINENLAILYEDLIEQEQITEEMLPALAEIAYRTEIICKNPKMKGVFVVHKELSKEEYMPLVDQVAYVDVLTDEVAYYFVDEKEQRYVASVEYEEKRLLKETDQLQNLLYQAHANLYQYVECLAAEGAFHSYDEASAQLCKQAIELPNLKEEYQNDLMEQLIYYYQGLHNIEALDYYLTSIRLSQLKRRSRCNILEICIQRKNYDQVVEDIKTSGFEDLSAGRLSKLCIRLIGQEEQSVSAELLLDMCLSAFFEGNRESELIRYLAEHYVGATNRMIRVWKAATSDKLAAHALEEQILAQTLFTRGDISQVQEIFLSYYRYAPKADVSHAYLNYASALYLMKDIQPSLDLLGCMKHEVIERKNLYCVVSLLKYFSEHPEEVTPEEREFVSEVLDQAIMNEVLLPQFTRLEEKVNLPNVMRNKTWIQYRTETGNNVKLFYRILSSEEDTTVDYTSEVMVPSIFGVYVRSFVLFYHEVLEYYFTEEIDGKEVSSEVLRTHYEPAKKNYHSTFEELNSMLERFQQKDSDDEELAKLIENYVKKDYIVQHYFRAI